MWQILLLYAIFSCTFPLGKYAMSYSQPIFFVGVRMIFAGLLLLGYQYIFTTEKLSIKKKDRVLFLHLALFSIYISYCSQYWALPYVSATKWALLYTICPFVTAFFSYVHFAEKLTWRKVFGLLLGLVGLIPALLFGTSGAPISSLTSVMYITIPILQFCSQLLPMPMDGLLPAVWSKKITILPA